MKKIVISALAIAAMVSCSKTELETRSDTSNAIVFGSSIDTDTKRTDASTSFDNGEKINVYGYRMNAPAPTINFTADLFLTKTLFTYSAGQFTSTDVAAMWKLNKAHNFYAYYPTTLTVTNTSAGATAPLTVEETTGIVATNDVMIAKVEGPLHDGTTTSAVLNFKHILSKVRFRIKKELPTNPNAVLTKVEFKMKSKTGSVNLVTGAVAKTAGSVTMSRDLSLNVSSTTTVDVPGNWMVLPADEISDMILTIDGQPMRVINAGSTITTKPNKVSTVTITIKASSITFTSEIEAWGEDPRNGEDLKPELPGPIIEYGLPPYNASGSSIATSTTTSYNGKYGAGGNNGTYRADATAAYTAEPPYHKFEVAKIDAYVSGNNKGWVFLQGTAPAPDRSDNICVKVHGKGWRIPRLSEFRLIWENLTALNASGSGFAAITSSSYWTATEYSGDDAWYVILDSGVPTNAGKSDATNHVRCIKELP